MHQKLRWYLQIAILVFGQYRFLQSIPACSGPHWGLTEATCALHRGTKMKKCFALNRSQALRSVTCPRWRPFRCEHRALGFRWRSMRGWSPLRWSLGGPKESRFAGHLRRKPKTGAQMFNITQEVLFIHVKRCSISCSIIGEVLYYLFDKNRMYELDTGSDGKRSHKRTH